MLKSIICMLVALSFVFAGTPVLAAAGGMPCPMQTMHSGKPSASAQPKVSDLKMGMKGCDQCPKSAEKDHAGKSKKSGCCDDPACNAKCGALSSLGGHFFLPGDIRWNGQTAKEQALSLPCRSLSSYLLKTPEKPPKYLS